MYQHNSARAPRVHSAKENRRDFAFQWKAKEFYLSSLDHSASAESIRPCKIVLASFNSLQSDASMMAKEKRQELLPAILDSWREYPAKCCSPGACGGVAQFLPRQS